jgi:hypothetical protein
MSFDPSDEYRPELPPPGPDYSPDLPPVPGVSTREAARQRVRLPAIFLIVVAVLNLLGALASFGLGFTFSRMPPAELEKQAERQNPGQWQELKKQGYTAQDLIKWYTYAGFGGAGVNILSALVAILGGVRMLQLKSYGLAVFASVLAALPILSCMGCCGIGEGIGIWAIVVLLNPDVRAAFQ